MKLERILGNAAQKQVDRDMTRELERVTTTVTRPKNPACGICKKPIYSHPKKAVRDWEAQNGAHAICVKKLQEQSLREA